MASNMTNAPSSAPAPAPANSNKEYYKQIRSASLAKFAQQIADEVNVMEVQHFLNMNNGRPWTMPISCEHCNILNPDDPVPVKDGGSLYFTKEKFLQLESGLKQLRHVLATNHFGEHNLWVQIFVPRGTLRDYQLRLSYRRERTQ